MPPPRFPSAVPERVRVILATRTLLSFISTWRAAALVMVELGAVAFFASGVAEARIGPSAPWFVLGAVIVGFLLRAVDIEARSLFVPGGLFGSVRETLGGGLATIAVSTHVAERLLLGPVAAAVAGRYAVRFLSDVGRRRRCPGRAGFGCVDRGRGRPARLCVVDSAAGTLVHDPDHLTHQCGRGHGAGDRGGLGRRDRHRSRRRTFRRRRRFPDPLARSSCWSSRSVARCSEWAAWKRSRRWRPSSSRRESGICSGRRGSSACCRW